MADKILIKDGKLIVPDQPIIPFIEGDGIGPDIWAAAQRVIDAAVEHTYHGARKIEWLEVLCGEKSYDKNGEWLPEETLETLRPNYLDLKMQIHSQDRLYILQSFQLFHHVKREDFYVDYQTRTCIPHQTTLMLF